MMVLVGVFATYNAASLCFYLIVGSPVWPLYLPALLVGGIGMVLIHHTPVSK